MAELREQFIAVLGHDLRSPLSSIDAGIHILRRNPSAPRRLEILDLVANSVSRMSALIGDVLDLARARLGGGLALNVVRGVAVERALHQIIEEHRTAWPERVIEVALAVDDVMDCDRGHIARLLQNLLSNALSHGAADGPVRVRATTMDGCFEISVANTGAPIPSATRARLFRPFFRAAASADGGSREKEGLGLGLYIASEIARAHGGALTVASSPEETRFTFRMPANPSLLGLAARDSGRVKRTTSDAAT